MLVGTMHVVHVLQVAFAVEHLHSCGIVHRDVTSKNILLQECLASAFVEVQLCTIRR